MRYPAHILLALTCLVAGCGGEDSPVSPLLPFSITVAVSNAALTSIGETTNASAAVFDSKGGRIGGQTVVWSSSDSQVVTVDTSGLVTATGEGSAQVTARAGGVSGSAAVTVQQVPASLVKTQGDEQEGEVGLQLPVDPQIRLTDGAGSPISGRVIFFDVTAGDGSATASVTTDQDGHATAPWSLGQVAGAPNRLGANFQNLSVEFSATAHSGPAASLTTITAENLDFPAGDALVVQAIVRDRFDNPIEGLTILWQVTEGGGAISEAESLSGADGVATTTWTLGTSPGANALSASSGALPAAEFSVRGTADPVVELTVDWAKLDAIQLGVTPAATTGSTINAITHLGLRIVGDDGTVVIQSFARTDGDQVFRIEDPAMPMLSINLVAVRNASGPLVIQYGVALDVAIEPLGLIPFSVDDFEWSAAEWKVHPDAKAEYDTGTLTADKNAQSFDLPILARDPFQIGAPLAYEDMYLGITGRAFGDLNTDGWRNFRIATENATIGVASQTQVEFFPYLKQAMFGLPSGFGRYMVAPAGSFLLVWQ